MLFVFHLRLEGITEVDTDPEKRFVFFKVTTSNESSVCAPSEYTTREQLVLYYKKICKIKMREMKTK